MLARALIADAALLVLDEAGAGLDLQALSLHCIIASAAAAAELGTAQGFTFRWDNSLQYSAGMRLTGIGKLTRSYPNVDDGDRNFAAGLMTDRFDLTSVLDATGETMGARTYPFRMV